MSRRVRFSDRADEVAFCIAHHPDYRDLRHVCREYRFDKTRRWRFDLAWPALRIAVEIHGGTRSARGRRNSHAGPKGLQRDLEKARGALFRGWRLLAYTDLDLEEHGVALIVDEVRRLRDGTSANDHETKEGSPE